MEKILALDPGESTGWVAYSDNQIGGGTIKLDRVGVWSLLTSEEWDIMIFETFSLYASHARTLIGSTFYTCELIGIIKLVASLRPRTNIREQGAHVKKYSGASTRDEEWRVIKTHSPGTTGHTFDAYQHLMYYLKNKKAAL